jgi:hypothetical protein
MLHCKVSSYFLSFYLSFLELRKEVMRKAYLRNSDSVSDLPELLQPAGTGVPDTVKSLVQL